MIPLNEMIVMEKVDTKGPARTRGEMSYAILKKRGRRPGRSWPASNPMFAIKPLQSVTDKGCSAGVRFPGLKRNFDNTSMCQPTCTKTCG
jgi:hypothetical protein